MPTGIYPRKPIMARFWDKINISSNGCWEWLGASGGCGYTSFKIAAHKTTLAHRFSYETFKDKLPAGLVIDHLCRNKKCVNPLHLEAVTQSENVLRGIGLITHCPQGHLYDEINTYLSPAGKRGCRICRKLAYHRWLQRSRICFNLIEDKR